MLRALSQEWGGGCRERGEHLRHNVAGLHLPQVVPGLWIVFELEEKPICFLHSRHGSWMLICFSESSILPTIVHRNKKKS